MVTRVLLLTQWFEPEPTFKGLSFAKELIRQGLEVEVVTGFPNYPGGKLYPGYKVRLLKKELLDGVQVVRVPLYPSHDRSAMKRVFNYVSFSVSSFVYCLFCLRKIDVIYAYHPPLTVGITASLLRIFRRIPIVYDIQDLWPDTLRATGMLNNEIILRLIGSVCNLVYKIADHIVVLSPGFKRILIDRGVPEGKIDVICNWADENKLEQPSGLQGFNYNENKSFRIMFAGNMGNAQALNAVLEAANILRQRNSHIQFILIGAGLEVDRLKKRKDELGLSNVEFLPSVPMHEIGAYLNTASALLVHLRSDELFKITIPSKTQAYMAVGKPILMAVEGDAAELVQTADCGVLAHPENPLSIADAAENLARLSPQALDAMGKRGFDYYQEHLSMRSGVAKFKHIFEHVV